MRIMRVVARDAGVVDEYVHPSERLVHAFEQCLDVLGRGDVALKELAPNTRLAHRFRGLLGRRSLER
jgi:hypothetical protein